MIFSSIICLKRHCLFLHDNKCIKSKLESNLDVKSECSRIQSNMFKWSTTPLATYHGQMEKKKTGSLNRFYKQFRQPNWFRFDTVQVVVERNKMLSINLSKLLALYSKFHFLDPIFQRLFQLQSPHLLQAMNDESNRLVVYDLWFITINFR